MPSWNHENSAQHSQPSHEKAINSLKTLCLIWRTLVFVHQGNVFCQLGHQGRSFFKTCSQSLCTAPMAGIYLPSGLHKETVSGPWKMVEIPNGLVSLQSIADLGHPTLYLNKPIEKQWCQPKLSQLEAMSHTPLTVLLPPGWDYVTVYWCTE